MSRFSFFVFRFSLSLHRFALFTAACTCLLLVAGTLVTSNDAGLAVPDWPLSYGSLMPPMVGGIFYEHGHRMVATFVGLLTIVLAVWLSRREPRRWVRRIGWAALAAVVLQGLLGGLTVLFFLPAPVSISHAALAQLFFCITVTLALVTGPWWHSAEQSHDDTGSPPLREATVFTCVAVFIQLLLGAAYRHNALGIVAHIIWALVVAAGAWYTSMQVIRRFGNVSVLRRAAQLLFALVDFQLLLGAAAYWSLIVTREAPQPIPLMVWATVAHVVVGALTLAASVLLALCCFRVLRPARSPQVAALVEHMQKTLGQQRVP